jgi:hypothetical protein
MRTFPYDPSRADGLPELSGASLRGSPHAPLHFDAEQAGFELVTRGRRGLGISLVAQDIVDLGSGQAVSRRVRRIIRHTGGEAGLHLFGRGTLEGTDLRRIDLQTLRIGLDLLRRTPGMTGVLPVFWRTLATSHGRFALLYAGTSDGTRPAGLSMEIMGGTETSRLDMVAEVIEQFQSGPIGMILHAAPDVGIGRQAASARAACLCLDFAGVDHLSPEGKAGARDLIATARQVAPTVLLVNLRPDWAPAAHEAGATHAVFAPMEKLSL